MFDGRVADRGRGGAACMAGRCAVPVGWAKARLRAVPTNKTPRETLVGTPSDAFASDSFAHPTRWKPALVCRRSRHRPLHLWLYAPSTMMTMSFSSVDCLRNAISG